MAQHLAESRLVIHEIYASIQGESSHAGWPCVFVRTTGCPLRCSYCDTPQAFHEGTEMRAADVLDRALSFGVQRVEVTGGEPLVQRAVLPLMTALADAGRTVLLETAGAHDIAPVDPRVHIILDIKCPGSAENARVRWENLALLRPKDEVKLVLVDRADYEFARRVIAEHELGTRCGCVLLSPVTATLAPEALARWMLEDRLPARLQLQLHKLIWSPDARGV